MGVVPLDAYRASLCDVARCCAAALAELGVPIALPRVSLVVVGAGLEFVRAEHPSTVSVGVSSLTQLVPPPVGLNVIYGTCHEVGHLCIAQQCPSGRLPPVVWDEAIAHLLVLDVFFPRVRAEGVPGRWPGGYVDFPGSEFAGTPSGDPGYFELLARQTQRLRSLAAEVDGGIGALLRSLTRIGEPAAPAHDWLRVFTRVVRSWQRPATVDVD